MDFLKLQRYFNKRPETTLESQQEQHTNNFSTTHRSHRSHHSRVSAAIHRASISITPNFSEENSDSQEANSEYSLSDPVTNRKSYLNPSIHQNTGAPSMPSNSPTTHISGPTLPTKPESSSSSLLIIPLPVTSSSSSAALNLTQKTAYDSSPHYSVHHTNSQNFTVPNSTTWDNAYSQPKVSRLRSMMSTVRSENQRRFASLLIRQDLVVVQAICTSVLYEDKVNHISTCIVALFQEQGLALSLCRQILRLELTKAIDEGTLLRNKSAATLLCSAYVRLNCEKYLSLLFKPLINQLLSAKISIEIDPKRMEPGEDLSRNVKNLCRVTKKFLDDICNSIDYCPRRLRQLNRILQEEVMSKYPESPNRSMGGFFFLRFLCPAIVTPEAFNLTPAHTPELSHSSRRSLILVSKVLQSLTNGVLFGEKEDYMVPLNQFILDNSSRLNQFFTALTVCRFDLI
eukprot:TRINITY_DN1760_c0_g1_i1.p1 TRINITY_DN1760_c0_g1~~TRINITY_DN1760_c0_g1_i1.p1  ORF type:complete len:457 (-),score=86.26 TRINITY_DN1760_c0_g1_i1:296-1666(-)